MDQKNLELNMRLTKLEESYFSLSAHLEGERVLRKVEDDKCKQLCDFLAKQILEIKEKQPTQSINEVLLSFKDELLNIIETKIDSKILENKKNLEIQYVNIIEKINKNKNKENFDNKKIDNELIQNKNEINNINKKIEYIENIYDKKIKEISSKAEDAFNEYNNITKKIKDFNIIIDKFKNEQKYNMNKINSEIESQINYLNDSIEGKINNIHINSINNEQKKNLDLSKIGNNLSLLKSDFDSLSNNYLKEIDELRKNVNQENNLKMKEISNFEQHFLIEYENFTNFITKILNQNIEKIKSMNDYMNSDIEIVKNKNQYLEETLLKMREDVYDSMEKNIKYVLDKIHTYLDIQDPNISSNFEKNENYENNENKEYHEKKENNNIYSNNKEK